MQSQFAAKLWWTRRTWAFAFFTIALVVLLFAAMPAKAIFSEWRAATSLRNHGWGVEYYGLYVDSISCPKGLEKLSPEDAEHIRALGKLRLLSLRESRLSDPSWRAIEGIDSIQIVDGYDMTLSTQAVESLSTLHNLEQLILSLSPSRMEPVALAPLSRLRHLRGLSLGRVNVQDADMKAVGQLTTLTALGLDHTPITDRGLTYLKALPELEMLDLRHTAITEQAVGTLVQFPKLQYLDLNGVQFSDTAIFRLAQVPGLQIIRVDRGDVSEPALTQIRKTRPNLISVDLK